MNLLTDDESGAKIIGPVVAFGGDTSTDTIVSVLRGWGVDLTIRTDDGHVEITGIVESEVWQDTTPGEGSVEVVTFNDHTGDYDGPRLVLDIEDIVGFTVL